MQAILDAHDRRDHEASLHPFLRLAGQVPSPGATAEARKELGFFALALGDALDILDRRFGDPVWEVLGLRARALAWRFRPEDPLDAGAHAFESAAEDLRDAAFLVMGHASVAADAVEALAVLAALDSLARHLDAALPLASGRALPEGGLTPSVRLVLEAQRIDPQDRERALRAVHAVFDACQRLLDHLFRTVRENLWMEQGA
ncbi:MAG TPA: hypothetical protein VJ600_10815 [Holophagaceae bacterium]|nr:hypothetical protein [Holophagaceae bacterium]